METPRTQYNKLIAKTLANIETNQAIGFIGKLIDLAAGLGEEDGSRQAIAWFSEISSRELTDEQRCKLEYFTANAWADIARLSRHGKDIAFDWEQEEFEKRILHLRSAKGNPAFEGLPLLNRCQILTNLGNTLSEVGRFVEAVEHWDSVIKLDESFGMAIGNKGFGLSFYANALYDCGHARILCSYAKELLQKALSCSLEHSAKKTFEDRQVQITTWLDNNPCRKSINLEKFSLGKSESEIRYRRWCLRNRLFLNPLNDIGPYPIAARDVLSTPSMVAGINEGPGYQGFFNQMKQEFVSSRYLYYEGITINRPHFSDNGVLLLNTLDYPAYSLSVEKVKAAFRMAYSLFDKIAWFLLKYMRIEDKLNSKKMKIVKFRNIWYDNLSKEEGLWSDFEQYKNRPLRGLFWLSKDLFEDRPEFKECMEPDAQELWKIRNHLEHKYLKLHDSLGTWIGDTKEPCPALKPFKDELAYSLYRSDFEAKTLRLIKMVRASLIYLSLGIHCEELRRKQEKNGEHHAVPVILPIYDDNWKR